LAAADWKRRLAQFTGDRLTELLAAEEPAAHARTLGRQLLHHAFQGVDAINQVARFAPENDDLMEALDTLTEDFAASATFDMVGAVTALGQSEEEAEALLDMPETEAGERVYRRRSWHCPPASTLSQEGQKRLEGLAAQAEGQDLSRIWPWLNGRRSVVEIWARLLVSGEVPLAVLEQYLRLMAEEGFAEEQ